MQNTMIRRKHSESGFSLQEILIIFFVVAVIAVVLILLVGGVFGSAHKSRLSGDLKSVQTAVDDYYLRTLGKAPTFDGNLPAAGQLALINFNASYTEGSQTYSFINLIKRLPRHYDEGVWYIDNQGNVSCDIDPKKY